MAWFKKYQYKTWIGELCGNTITLIISLALISFLAIASAGSVLAIAATSFWWSRKARWNPFRSGFLPAIIATSMLQAGYFLSGRDLIQPSIMAAMFLVNLVIIVVVSGVFSGLGAWLRNRKIRKEQDTQNALERNRSQFSNNLRRIAILVLFFYVQMFVVVPLAAKVSAASTTQDSDNFIQNYDPANKYGISTSGKSAKPKRHVGLESPYGNVTGAELEQLEAYCQANGCELNIVGAQLSKLRSSGNLSLDDYFEQLNKVYAPKPPAPSWQDGLILPKMAKAVTDALTGKHKAAAKPPAKPDNRPWYQKAWEGAKGAYNAFQRFDHAVSKKLIEEPLKNAWNFTKAHPWQAAGMAAIGVGVIASSIIWAPVATALGAAAVITAGIAAVGLAKAYHDDGWNGVANNVFSKETRAMWNTGDKAGAAGQGLVELGGKVLELLPLAGAPKTVAEVVKLVPEIRVSISIMAESGSIGEGGVKVLNSLSKLASGNTEDLKAVSTFVKNLAGNEKDLALVAGNGKSVEEAGALAGADEGYVASKKAEGIYPKVVDEGKANHTPLTQEKFQELNVPKKDFHSVQFTNKSYGVKADTSNFADGSLQHIFEGEINADGKAVGLHIEPGSTAPSSRIIPDNPNVGPDEIYTGKVEINGIAKSTNGGKSTFFPKSWSKERTIEEIDSAYRNKVLKPQGWYEGTSKSGVKIEMYLDGKTGKITAPRPKWPQ